MRGGEGFGLVYICKMRRREKGVGMSLRGRGGGGKRGSTNLMFMMVRVLVGYLCGGSGCGRKGRLSCVE